MGDKIEILGPCPHCETSIHVREDQEGWHAIHDCPTPFHYPKPYPGSEKPFKGKEAPE